MRIGWTVQWFGSVLVLGAGTTGCGIADEIINAEDQGFIELYVSSGCGYTGNIIGTIDGANAGVFTIAGPIHKAVSAGHHDVGAYMPDGSYTYSSATVTVQNGATATHTFRCPMPIVRASVNGSCSGKTSAIDIRLDGVLLGRVEPNGFQVAAESSKGDHTISAVGTGNYSWSVSKTLGWAQDWTQVLAC